MSGHSKWSKVKHQKSVTDAVKSSAFTKASHAITIAVREAGGITDPNDNFRLRLAIEKAKAVNMPKENIARAIERGKGEEGGQIESIEYEAYGPGGSALVIEATTDNRQRTVSQVKNVLDRAGGTLASPGAVNYLFRRAGVLTVGKSAGSENDLLNAALEAGASDFVVQDDVYEIYTEPQNLHAVSEKLGQRGYAIDNASLIFRPLTQLTLVPKKESELEKLVTTLEELEDVQTVFTNTV